MSQNFFHNVPSHHMSASISIIALRRTGDRPLPESVITTFCHMSGWAQNETWVNFWNINSFIVCATHVFFNSNNFLLMPHCQSCVTIVFLLLLRYLKKTCISFWQVFFSTSLAIRIFHFCWNVNLYNAPHASINFYKQHNATIRILAYFAQLDSKPIFYLWTTCGTD